MVKPELTSHKVYNHVVRMGNDVTHKVYKHVVMPELISHKVSHHVVRPELISYKGLSK